MASIEDQKKELESGFTLVQRKNMKRGKPQQQIYRPGSGPLRKSNTLEESESDTNLMVNSRHNQSKHDFRHVEDSRNKSEGSSPRDKSTEIDKAAAQFRDISLNKDSRRNKKPEQPFYVPKPLAQAQAREISASQDINRNSRAQSNGNEKHQEHKEPYGNRQKPYMEKRRNDRGGDQEDTQAKWRDRSPGNIRQRQGSEPRDGMGMNWNRTRDTRSVEPSAHPNRNYEKIQSKPPSGRRHSSVGLEERYSKLPMKNLDNIPPRFRKKFLQETNLPEENWDGTSLTFQGHNNFNSSKNSSYHPMNTVYNTLPNSQNYANQNLSNVGYHTLPNKPRGRGRWFQDQDMLPGQGYRSMTPDSVRSPSNSRPPTPPTGGIKKFDNKPQCPETYDQKHMPGKYNVKYSDERTREMDNKKDYDNQRNFNGPRRLDTNNDNLRYDRKRQDLHENDNRNRRDRDMLNKRDRETPNRDGEAAGRDGKGRGNYNRDKRDRRDKRSRSRDYYRNTNSRGGNRYESNRNDENKNSSVSTSNEVKNNVEVQLTQQIPAEEKPVVSETIVVNTTLDWSEEVELNDRLEAEIFSDAPTRSSSITSLHEINAVSLPPNINNPPASTSKRQKRKNHKGSRNRSGARESSRSRTRGQRQRQNSTTSIDSRDGFKHPQENYFGRRRTSRDRRESSFDRYRNSSRNPSRESSWDRQNMRSGNPTENWREEIVRSRQNSEREVRDVRGKLEEIKNVDANTKKAGVIVLTPQKPEPVRPASTNTKDQPRYPETRRSLGQQKSLFDPNNPSKPIVVKSPGSRISVPGFPDNTEDTPPQINTTDQFGNVRPSWYDEMTDEFKSCYFPELLRDVKRADLELQYIINNGWLLVNWGLVDQLRQFLKEALEYLLCKSIKFCQTENVEQHFWKILYHNIIEVTRKAIKSDPENKEKYKAFLLYLIDEGTKYFENLLGLLESTYKFKLGSFLGENNMAPQKGLGLVVLALVSAQKLFLFLGDLGRYREEVNETSNYGKCRLWYIKSQEINPKNGKPYNQLALLAVYARRKLDAVYYYMRSLMASNPVQSAKESLVSLFDEIRKKYVQGEKKRREERLERQRLQMKQKESEDTCNVPGSLRKETWIHPEGGRRVHRTTQANPDENDSEEEDLASLSSVEVNKRFIISYLHVQGKLITKIGMESFQETALQMLKEFRALLQQSPVPLPCNRFLQLLALNMYAIESTQLKDPALQSQSGYRSEFQERALVVSLQMFDLILERCIAVLRDHLLQHQKSDAPVDFLPPDGEVLLPAVKVWCDWMLCHTDVWNPPPSTRDFRIKGSSGDAWSRLATLMNLLEQMDQSASADFIKDQRDGYDQIRLPEDSVLNGFTPLMYTYQEGPTYAPKDIDAESAHFSLRLNKLLFFGTEYLCGVDPPVLKLEIDDNAREYVSVVSSAGSRDSPPSPQELAQNNDILLESFSSEEDVNAEEEKERMASNAPSEIRDLLTRKVELEKRKRSQELHMQRVKKILSQSVVSVHMEVRPKNLVPDTNCFIDHLENIRKIAQCNNYTLMVPIVVLSELEGLSRGGKTPSPDSRHFVDPQHVIKVASSAKDALDFLKTRHASVKCVTTKGVIIPSTTFSTEDDATNLKNDDKILTTCLALCKGHKEQTQNTAEGEPRHLVREVVLLTEDRNLRVKAHARDVPVRELPDFMRWAGLG